MRRQLSIEKAQTPARTTISYIRLRGRWLRDLGFDPGGHVDVSSPAPGMLELKAATKTPLVMRALK